jgi:hypothetical protein
MILIMNVWFGCLIALRDSKFHGRRDTRHFLVHHIAHAREFECVNAVFARDVMTAAGEFFREDGTPHE